MKDFLKKTLYLWISIICIGIAIGLFYLLTDFFEHGGGFIRVKGIIAPAVFAILGLWSFWIFIKKSINEKNYLELIASVLLIAVVVTGFFYFSSIGFKSAHLLDKIKADEITEDECISEITIMLNDNRPESRTNAIECLKALTEKGSAQAWFKLGELYFDQGDYGDAENSFINVCNILEPKEVEGTDYKHIGHDLSLAYEYLGNIYNTGLSGDTDKQKALLYYERAIQYPFNMHSNRIQSAIDSIKQVINEPII